jgi:hypothetical protein
MAKKDKENLQDQTNLSEQLERSMKKQRQLQLDINLGRAEDIELFKKRIDLEKKFRKIAKENKESIEAGLEKADNLGESIENSIKSIPILGPAIIDKFGLSNLGDQFKNIFADTLKGGIKPIGKFLMGPTGIVAGIAAIALAFRQVRKASFDLAENLGVSRSKGFIVRIERFSTGV